MARERRTRVRSNKQEKRVYVLLEEARLRCEALRDAADSREPRAELHRLHRDLGLSALNVSAYIPSDVRLGLLARVHARCDGHPGTRRGLERTLRRASRELARVAAAADTPEHVELAHLHLLRALELAIAQRSPRPSISRSLSPWHVT